MYLLLSTEPHAPVRTRGVPSTPQILVHVIARENPGRLSHTQGQIPLASFDIPNRSPTHLTDHQSMQHNESPVNAMQPIPTLRHPSISLARPMTELDQPVIQFLPRSARIIPYSQHFYQDLPGVIDLETFITTFKIRRDKLSYTQRNARQALLSNLGINLSHTTISRFENLNLATTALKV